ncbi:MAG TPA: hypothetical protein DCZ94_12925 [Lentisphaeria bacterium]|nr:MAG: hypothetical protein A2X48_06055 [Lentisphaerae bacterium GWF2_49_21]HBC87851.1 hypothetical protein [Lentisphaeria bacterium]
MLRQLISIIISGLLVSSVIAQDEPGELVRARSSYQSQLKTAMQSCKQKVEGLDKIQSPEEKTKELNKLKVSYQQQLEFIAKSYLSKLDSMKKLPSFNRNQANAIRNEISSFEKPDPSVLPGTTPEKPAAKNTDDKTGKNEGAPKNVTPAVDEGEELDEDEIPGLKPVDGKNSETDVAGVQATTLEDAKAKNHEEIKKFNLSELKGDWIKERREFAAKRPRPENYIFTQAAFNSYVATIPEDKRELEEKRFKQLGGIKDYMCRLMERNTYPKPVSLKGGSRSSGIMVNPNYIAAKSGSRYKRLGWDSLPVNEAANILAHFAAMRLKITNVPGVSKDELKRMAAEDYLRIGMLCDWYEEYDDAVKYAKKAVEADPKIEEIVKKYMMQ